jgi:transposase
VLRESGRCLAAERSVHESQRQQEERRNQQHDATRDASRRCGNRYWCDRDIVAVPAERAEENVRCFPTFTQDLYALADWLAQCGVKTVAMESTGVYWIPLFQILEERGLEVCLVNARHVKNVPGRRTDVSDCQWLQFLHSVGWLRASYRPEQEICAVRSLLRHRESLVQMAATHVHHMQKALDQMNLPLHHVISDITGQTGLAIVDAILSGERNPQVLAGLRNERIKAPAEVIAKSLVGDYRPEHLFTLRQSLAAYRSYQELIAECEREIRHCLHDVHSSPPSDSATPDPAQSQGRKPSQEGMLHSQLKRIFGTDLTKIPGIRVGIAQTLWGEVGPNFTKFRSASAFASWMGSMSRQRN